MEKKYAKNMDLVTIPSGYKESAHTNSVGSTLVFFLEYNTRKKCAQNLKKGHKKISKQN